MVGGVDGAECGVVGMDDVGYEEEEAEGRFEDDGGYGRVEVEFENGRQEAGRY